jgi:hypothetical protein
VNQHQRGNGENIHQYRTGQHCGEKNDQLQEFLYHFGIVFAAAKVQQQKISLPN